MTPEELNNIGIRQWKWLSHKFKQPDLLLGNGFSINLSGNFKYASLFDNFMQKVPDKYETLFGHFGTTNFELILSYLTHALKVNEILGLPTDLITNAIEELKNGLIASIKEIHPRAEDINWNKVENITRELENFGDIFSTNYDLYLYHIIMKSIDISREKKEYVAYQDYFWGTAENGYKQFMSYQGYQYKNVYYLHGALCIFNHDIRDLKIIRGSTGEELIEIIACEIQKNHFPLFVTEGSSQDKMSSIYRSNYLFFCMKKLKETNRPLLIFGNSLSQFDRHIVEAIKTTPRDLIISIYTTERPKEELEKEKQQIISQFESYKSNIEFVDSSTVF